MSPLQGDKTFASVYVIFEFTFKLCTHKSIYIVWELDFKDDPPMKNASAIHILLYYPPLESGLDLWLTVDKNNQVEVMLSDF